MAIDIANPGGSDAALKDALATLTGRRLLTPRTQIVAASFLSIALPGTASCYEIQMSNVKCSATNESPVIGVSADDGATWFNDHVNFDTYGLIEWFQSSNGSGFQSTIATLVNDGLMDFGVVNQTQDIVIRIFPGDDSHSPRIQFDSIGMRDSGDIAMMYKGYSMLNQAATNPPTYARINRISIQPYGNGDIPPTSDVTLLSGDYSVWALL